MDDGGAVLALLGLSASEAIATGIATGPVLVVGGSFTHAGGLPSICIALWEATGWRALGGIPGSVNDATIFDDGTGFGRRLLVAGLFNSSSVPGGPPLKSLAIRHGAEWLSFEPDFVGYAWTILVNEDPASGRRSLLVGGDGVAFPGGDAFIAEWVAPGAPVDGSPDLNGDGVVDALDLALLIAAWNTSSDADLDGDGVVDAADLGLLRAAWSG